MNQSTPPNNPYEQAAPGPDMGAEGNPYLNQHGRAAAPDLDAAAPSLRVEEQQRINRKALMFLAAIVALLVLMAIFVMSGSDDDDRAAPDLRDVASAPEAPGAPQLPMVEPAMEPIPVQSYDAASTSGLPPLPSEPTQTTYPSDDYAGRQPATAPAEPRPPSLLERRMGMMDASGSGATAEMDIADGAVGLQGQGQGQGPAQPGAARATREGASSARVLRNPDALLVRGTYVRCVLETRIITDVPGFTSCIVTEPVYSINGRSLLLPKGSKISGRYEDEPSGPRVAVVWDRITTPNGIDVNMSSPGVDNLGGAGHPGHYTNHWPSKIASALMISLVADAFKYAAAENGPPTTAIGDGVIVQNPYESVTARSMERMANEAISKNLRRPATVTINQGTLVNVYVARDVDFSGVVARR